MIRNIEVKIDDNTIIELSENLVTIGKEYKIGNDSISCKISIFSMDVKSNDKKISITTSKGKMKEISDAILEICHIENPEIEEIDENTIEIDGEQYQKVIAI